MSLKKKLMEFNGALTSATFAPDEYPFPELIDFKSNMSTLSELWSEIRVLLVVDQHRVSFVDDKLVELKSAFLAGKKAEGLQAVMDIYNLDVEKFS